MRTLSVLSIVVLFGTAVLASGPTVTADKDKAAGAAATEAEGQNPPVAVPVMKESSSSSSAGEAVTGNFVELHCYHNAAVKDHIYTVNTQELGAGKGEWKSCGSVGMVNADPEEGYEKLLRYLDLHNIDHIYANKEQIESKTLRPEGFEGYVSTKQLKGMIALDLYFNEKEHDHILVTASSHPAGYKKVDTLGYVLPPPAVPTNGSKNPVGVKKQPKFWASNPIDTRLEPVFRYWNPALRDHFLTMNYELLGAGKNGWRYQGIQMYAYPTKIEGTVPMYRYWNLRLGDHFYTTDFYDMGEGKDGYRFKGILGYVREAPSSHTVPLYRYFNKEIGDHFYTTNTMSKARGHDDWKNEGIAAYVYPVPAPAKKGEADEYALLVPLYRYWNKRFADHFYTTIWKEVDVGTHGWQYQGVQALVYAKQQPGTVPLYRYWNIRTLDHFYTTNFKALGQGGKNGWKYEGIECYVNVYRKPGTVPMYRYFNNQLNDHFYTTKWLGRQYKNFVYEGVQAYVHRKPLDDGARGKVKAPNGMAPLYRYWSAALKDHMYTSNWEELGNGAQGYTLEGVEGFIWKSKDGATEALHRYVNPRVHDHFYTTDYSLLKSGGKDGWQYEGIVGYVRDDAGDDGAVKLNRYYSKAMADHFYTATYLGEDKHGYEFQGVAGYIMPHEDKLSLHATNTDGAKTRSAKSAEDLKDLHAYFNPTTKDHFYTTNFKVLGSGQKGWEYRGLIGRCSAKDTGSSLKLRQYFSKDRRDHRYTIRHIRGGDWTYEGTVCYVSTASFDGAVKLMNFENRRAMDNALSTATDGPKSGGDYRYIETLGFIAPPPKEESESSSDEE